MRKIHYKQNNCGRDSFTYSLWIDNECLGYGIESEKQAQFACQIARLALEKCGIKVLNSFDSQNP